MMHPSRNSVKIQWHRIGIATADALLGRWLMAVCVLRESTHYVLLIRPHSLRTGETPSGLLFDVGQVYVFLCVCDILTSNHYNS
ncbi:hypothetical protein PS1_004822 [Malus domestica]